MASFGLFGSSAPQIRRLQPTATAFAPTIEELRAQQVAQMQSAESVAPAQQRSGGIKLGAFGQGPTNPAPARPPQRVSADYLPAAPQAPTKQHESNPLLDVLGYDPKETDMNGVEWFFSSPARRDQARAELAGQRGAQQARIAQEQQINALRQSGVPETQIIAFLNNPEKWAENYSTNIAAANVDGGNSRMVNGELITAPKFGESDGHFYRQGPDGVAMQGRRPMSYAEQAAADKAKQPGIYNTGQAIVSVNPDGTKPQVLYRDPQGGGGSNGDNFRPATPEDLKAWNIPEGVSVKINTRTGEPQVISGARAPSLYTPTEQKTFHGKAAALQTLGHLTSEYKNLVNQYGPGLFDSNSKGEKTIEGQKLLAAHNNLMMYLKGPEMFNLGVLTGPDLERLQRTLPEPVGFGAFGQSKDTLNVGLQGINDLVNFQMNQIPDEFRNQPGQQQQAPPKPNMAQQAINGIGDVVKGVGGAFANFAPRGGQPQAAPDLSHLTDEQIDALIAQGGGR